MRILDRLSIYQKFMLMCVLFIISLSGVVGVNLYAQHGQLLAERMMKTRHLAEAAHTIIANAYAQEKAGTMTREQAQSVAKETLRIMRYEQKEYFWIHDKNGQAVMHPIFPNFEGGGLAEKNKKVFDLFSAMNTAIEKAKGPVPYDYPWPKATVEDKTIMFPKSSYVIPFEPWGWAVGTGIYIDDVDQAFIANLIEAGAGVLVIIAVLAVMTILIARNISKPMQFFAINMTALANGDTNIQSAFTDRGDEIGKVAKAFDVFKRNTLEKIRLELEQKESEKRSTAQARAAMMALADNFDARVGVIVSSVENSAINMQELSGNLAEMVNETLNQSESVANSSQQASANVGTVAAAAEELTASILEISKSLGDTAGIAKNCSSEADRSRESLNLLQKAVTEIDGVVASINDIAEQTNLLALNATIEAARAGEAGKGFAVVASEVKSLATETGKMTDEITKKVQSIKDNAGITIQRVTAIIDSIARVDHQTTSIAGAVEEQNAATKEISRNVQEAANGTGQVMQSIRDVQMATNESANATQRVKESSSEVAEQTKILKQAVNEFLREVRAS